MILLSAQRRTVPERSPASSTSSTRRCAKWIRRFDAAGPAGLYDAPRSGRPHKLSETVRDKLLDMIQQDPEQAGYQATFWTVAMLVLALRRQARDSSEPERCAPGAAPGQVSLGRPRLAMPPRPIRPKQPSNGPSPRP